jgi:hypothetical protein
MQSFLMLELARLRQADRLPMADRPRPTPAAGRRPDGARPRPGRWAGAGPAVAAALILRALVADYWAPLR